MKVAVITNLYPPFVRGGAEYLTHQVVLELVRQGHEVSVITSTPWKSIKRFKTELREEGGVNVYRFYSLNFYHYLTASRVWYPIRLLWHIVNIFNFPAAYKVKNVLRKVKPDLVVSSNLMGLSFIIPLVISRLGLKHIHILHDVQLLHPSGLFLWGEKRLTIFMRVYQTVTRFLFKPVPIVVSPSVWLLQEHSKRGFFKKSRMQVLPNPTPPTQARSENKTSRPPVKLLYVGQFETHKGVLWLVETLKGFTRHDFELHLYPLGQKPKTALIKKNIAGDSRFILHDLVSQLEIDSAYVASHLSIVPSLCYENSPVAIPMAFAAGTPVLAADIGGIPELIKAGETGWLFQPADKNDFQTKLNWCLDNPKGLLECGLRASNEFAGRTIVEYAKSLLNF